jgi:hypothetical protein
MASSGSAAPTIPSTGPPGVEQLVQAVGPARDEQREDARPAGGALTDGVQQRWRRGGAMRDDEDPGRRSGLHRAPFGRWRAVSHLERDRATASGGASDS